METVRRWSSPSKRAGDIYCRKGRVQVDPDPLHIHAGLKSVSSPTGIRRGTAKKKRAKGTMERIPIIHDAGWCSQRQSRSVWTGKRAQCGHWFRCLLCILDLLSVNETDDERNVINCDWLIVGFSFVRESITFKNIWFQSLIYLRRK